MRSFEVIDYCTTEIQLLDGMPFIGLIVGKNGADPGPTPIGKPVTVFVVEGDLGEADPYVPIRFKVVEED